MLLCRCRKVTFDDEDGAEWTRVDCTDKFQNVKEFSAFLHADTVGLDEVEVFDLVVRVEGCCGMEACREPTKRYDLEVARRSTNMLENVLNPPQCKASDVLCGVERWEQLFRRYADKKRSDGQKQSSCTTSSWAFSRRWVHQSRAHTLVPQLSEVHELRCDAQRDQHLLGGQGWRSRLQG